MLLNFFTQCARKFGKLINDHRTGKGQFHSVPKEAQESSPTPQFKSINSSSSAFFIA